jgi:hypothetical protein
MKLASYIRVGAAFLIVVVAFAPLTLLSFGEPCVFQSGMVKTPVSPGNPYGISSCDSFGGSPAYDLPMIGWVMVLCLIAFLLVGTVWPQKSGIAAASIGFGGFLVAVAIAVLIQGDRYGALSSPRLWVTGFGVAVYGWLTSRVTRMVGSPNNKLQRTRGGSFGEH